MGCVKATNPIYDTQLSNFSEQNKNELQMQPSAVKSVYRKGTLCRSRKMSEERGNLVLDLVNDGKPNRCVVVPPRHNMFAEAIERRNNEWFIRTEASTDLIIQLGVSKFHLHKLPIVSKSGYLSKRVFQKRRDEEETVVKIEDFPGGIETFELVVKFCYGWKIDISANNVGPLYCAAQFLEMSDELEPENLLTRTEVFLSFVIFSSWKDTFCVLRSCELVSSWAKRLQIVKRCAEAIAWKAFINAETIGSYESDEGSSDGEVAENWWFEDVSNLKIDHFIEVVEAGKRNGMKPEIVVSCIAHWTSRWLSWGVLGSQKATQKNLKQQLQKVVEESLIVLLSSQEKNSVSCNLLLHLLKLGLVLKINSELLDKLENRVASMLEGSSVSDLLVKNYKENESLYDVVIVARVLRCYSCSKIREGGNGFLTAGRLLDGYLIRIARDKKLKVQDFQILAETLPKIARNCHDYLYRAIDSYLKAHPGLTDEERSSFCKSMDYHKLSNEARQHAAKNNRLPLEIAARFILLEQVNMTRSMAAVGSGYRRTKTEMIIGARQGTERCGSWMKNSQEMMQMKKEMEAIRVQLSNVQLCKVGIQRQAKRMQSLKLYP